jgi:hypothetical protein
LDRADLGLRILKRFAGAGQLLIRVAPAFESDVRQNGAQQKQEDANDIDDDERLILASRHVGPLSGKCKNLRLRIEDAPPLPTRGKSTSRGAQNCPKSSIFRGLPHVNEPVRMGPKRAFRRLPMPVMRIEPVLPAASRER